MSEGVVVSMVSVVMTTVMTVVMTVVMSVVIVMVPVMMTIAMGKRVRVCECASVRVCEGKRGERDGEG